MHSKRKIPDSWRTGWKAKACTSFVLYLKVFKNHLYYLWHVRVLSIKPCLHTQLPEHNKSYQKVSRGWEHFITWNGPMDLRLFGLGSGEFEKKFSKNSNARGIAWGEGGMLKLRFDRYIISSFPLEQLQIAGPLWIISFTCVKTFWRTRLNTNNRHFCDSVRCK